jgi:zinc transporter ZupT
LFARLYFAKDTKKMSWIISLVNSFVLTIGGAIYLAVKVHPPLPLYPYVCMCLLSAVRVYAVCLRC